MSNRLFGFYFSANADASANDRTIYVELHKDGGTVTLAPRYKSSQPNAQYEIELDEGDLRLFGQMCIDLAEAMRLDAELVEQAQKDAED